MYRDQVKRTANSDNTSLKDMLTMGSMGLAGEAGEVTDLIKKHVFHGKELSRDLLVKELGDVRWYMEYLMIATGISMEEVEAKNVEKLTKRYPEGFSYKAANERKDENV